jgi:hypothetical protein
MQIALNMDIEAGPPKDAASDEWFTPLYIVNWLPPIALDPCANKRSRIIGTAMICQEDGQDGLALEWQLLCAILGIIFCNPPYSNCSAWVEKCAVEGSKGPFVVVALIPAYSGDAYWHRHIWGKASWVAYHRGRVRFDTGHGPAKDAASFTSALVCWGDIDGAVWRHVKERAGNRLFGLRADKELEVENG